MAKNFLIPTLLLAFFLNPLNATHADDSRDSARIKGIVAACLIGMGVVGAYVMNKSSNARSQQKQAATAAREKSEAEKRELDNTVLKDLKGMSKDDKKALTKKLFAESNTYAEYLSKFYQELGIPAHAQEEVTRNAQAILAASNLDFTTYKSSKAFIAEKITLYAITLTALRADQTQSIGIMQDALKVNMLLSVVDFFSSHEDDADIAFAKSLAKQGALSSGVDAVSTEAKRRTVFGKAKVLLGTEETIRNLNPLKGKKKDKDENKEPAKDKQPG